MQNGRGLAPGDMRVNRVLTLSMACCLGLGVLLQIPGETAGPAPALARGSSGGRGVTAAVQSAYAVQPQPGQPMAEIGRGYFTLRLRPAERSEVRVVVSNIGMTTLRVTSYAVDAEPITMGGVGFGLRSAKRSTVGAWITFEPISVVVAPGKSRVVVASIQVPTGRAPGQYVGGLAFENKLVRTTDPQVGASSGKKARVHHMASFLIDIHYRQVIPVVISVPGKPRLSMRIDGASLVKASWGSRATVVVHNAGAMMWNGAGTLQIHGPGMARASLPFTIDTILPGAVARVPVPLPCRELPAGTYYLRVSLRSPAVGTRIDWKGTVVVSTPAVQKATPVVLHVLQPAYPAPTATPVTR